MKKTKHEVEGHDQCFADGRAKYTGRQITLTEIHVPGATNLYYEVHMGGLKVIVRADDTIQWLLDKGDG